MAGGFTTLAILETVSTPRYGSPGYLSEILGQPPRILNRNHLLVAALLTTVGLLFVNGVYVARLDLSHNQDYGDVSAMGDFYLSHRGSPEFENFNVWVP